MSDRKDPYKRAVTKPLPRAELAPTETVHRHDADEETKVRCPACLGAAMLPADIAATVSRALAAESERR